MWWPGTASCTKSVSVRIGHARSRMEQLRQLRIDSLADFTVGGEDGVRRIKEIFLVRPQVFDERVGSALEAGLQRDLPDLPAQALDLAQAQLVDLRRVHPTDHVRTNEELVVLGTAGQCREPRDLRRLGDRK